VHAETAREDGHRQSFAPSRFLAEMAGFALHFQPTRVMNRHAPTKRRKGFTTMTNAVATITEDAATVAEQGAHIAPEKASSKKGATEKKSAPKGQKAANGKAKASQKKEAKTGKEGQQARPGQGSQRAARREQGRKDPGTDRAAQGGDPGGDCESHGLAET
jgi:hypothetical protein